MRDYRVTFVNQDPMGTVGGKRFMDRFLWLTFILMLGSAGCAAAAEKELASASKEPARPPIYHCMSLPGFTMAVMTIASSHGTVYDRVQSVA